MPAMHPELTELRHTVLFELLRQQNLSETTSARLRARDFARDRIDHDEAVALRSQAMNSWGDPAPELHPG